MFLPLAIVLLVAAAWSGYWFIASGIARDRLAEERARLAGEGLTLTCAQEGWGGYPFHFEFSCSSPAFNKAPGIELRSGNLMLVALAYAPWQVAALLDGPTVLSTPGLQPSMIDHQRALAAVTYQESQPSLSAEVTALTYGGWGKVGKVMVFTRPATSGDTDVAVVVSDLIYTPEGKPPLPIESGALQGTIQADQSFKVDKAELQQGALRYWGTGTLALDQQHRITGQLDTETNDIDTLLAIAGTQLGLSDGRLANLRTVLGLLGNRAKAPIIAKDGILYLGPFQVTELKPLY